MIEKLKEELEQHFKDLRFEEQSHSYSVNGERLKTSVTGLLKKYVRYVDFKKIAENIDKKNKFPSGTTSKQWKSSGEVACAIGNKTHLFGEVYTFNRSLAPTTGYEEAVVGFWNSLPKHIVPVCVELQMFHKQYMFGGTADIVLFNKKTKNFILGDYKTNKDLFKNHRKKKLQKPFSDLLDCPFNKYQIQLSLYQILFEQTGHQVEKRVVVWVKPDGTFESFDTENYTEILRKELSHAYN